MAEQARKNVKPFGFADKVGYFFGDFGNDFTFMLSSMFMMKFYTDVMGGFSRNRGTSDDGGAFCRCSDRCDNGTDCRPICTDEGWKVQTVDSPLLRTTRNFGIPDVSIRICGHADGI